MKTQRYSAVGPIRGHCCHAHRSIKAALECARRDQRACALGGGYSDRQVEAVEGRWLEPVAMSDGEVEALLMEEQIISP